MVLSQQENGSLSFVRWGGQRKLLGMTHANRAIHTHAASIMNTHIDAIGGLVSNPSDRETRGSRAHAAPLNLRAHAALLNLEVGTSSWAERHIAKRDIMQLSNRKLIDPSAPECRISAPECRISAYVGKITGRELFNSSVTCRTRTFPF